MRPPERKRKAKDQACFICGSNAPSTGYRGLKVDGESYDIVFCPGCGLGRTEPFMDEKRLRALYSSAYREEDSTRFISPLEVLTRAVRNGRCASIERYAKKGRILDVGCGRGDFLSMMAERGWEGVGLELDERIVGRGRTGVNLRHGSLDDVMFPDGHFDAVTFWHVFEHIREPVAALRECRRILKPGGLLMIAVPNMGSLQARLSGKGWFHLDPPFHLYHYSAANLKSLLGKEGFEVAGVSHFSLEYNPYGFIQSIYNRLGFPTNLLYDFLRSKGPKGLVRGLGLAINMALLPLVAPLSVLLSLIEAAGRMGGTIEVYARKAG